ncbi:MAG: CAAX prenyl protease-related protein [Verrucomicrobiota bacterium]
MIHPHALFITYPLSITAVALVLFYYWARLPKFAWKHPLLSIIIGYIASTIWIETFDYLPHYVDPTQAFNPYLFEDKPLQVALIAFRMMGTILITPIMAEVFWRGFIQRYFVTRDFLSIRPGVYTALSFWVTTLLFASVHQAYGVAFLVGILYSFWFVRTKSLGDIIITHATTNLFLSIHVLQTGKWYLW